MMKRIKKFKKKLLPAATTTTITSNRSEQLFHKYNFYFLLSFSFINYLIRICVCVCIRFGFIHSNKVLYINPIHSPPTQLPQIYLCQIKKYTLSVFIYFVPDQKKHTIMNIGSICFFSFKTIFM